MGVLLPWVVVTVLLMPQAPGSLQEHHHAAASRLVPPVRLVLGLTTSSGGGIPPVPAIPALVSLPGPQVAAPAMTGQQISKGLE